MTLRPLSKVKEQLIGSFIKVNMRLIASFLSFLTDKYSCSKIA